MDNGKVYDDYFVNANYDEVMEVFERMSLTEVFEVQSFLGCIEDAVKNYNDHQKIKYVGVLVNKCIKYINKADAEVHARLFRSIYDNKLFTAILLVGSRQLYKYIAQNSISNKSFFRFYEITEQQQLDEGEKMCIYNQLFQIVSGNVQQYLISLNEKYRYCYSYQELVEGIFEGYIRYDDFVKEKIKKWVIECIEGEYAFDISFEKDNPVYIILKLYTWGFINKYQLAEFAEFQNVSKVLYMSINIEEIDLEEIPRKWKNMINHCAKRYSTIG